MAYEVSGMSGLKRAGILAAAVIFLLGGCSAGEKKQETDPEKVEAKVCAYLRKNVQDPVSYSVGGEWTVMALARSKEGITENYKQLYLKNLKKKAEEKQGILSDSLYTEYARVVLALTSVKEDPKNFDTYDFLEPLNDYDNVIAQGLNGAAYALIALDSGNYESSEREAYREYLCSMELSGGGFALDEKTEEPEADATAIVLQALAPYQEDADIKAVIDRGLKVLSDLQGTDGKYVSFEEEGSETVSQIILALSALGIDCRNDADFEKDGKQLYDILLSYQNADGSFSHDSGGESDQMATEQAACALDAYVRYLNGEASFYSMS